MIITRILPSAGMGNQMFMYAAGLAASRRLNTELLLDNAEFSELTRDDRPYQLSHFPEITERTASFMDIWRMSPGTAVLHAISLHKIRKYHIFRRLLRKSLFMLNLAPVHHNAIVNVSRCAQFPYPYKYSRVFLENKAYKDRFTELPDNTYITGYWESEDYFADYAELVRKKFTFPQEYFNTALTSQVRSCNSVAVHVRRTDKVREDDSIASNLPYISKALKTIISMTDAAKFFVFSDDIEWCRQNLPKDYDYTFIDGQTPAQDMALMTQCKHVIMGPSTFSWWGAWLNVNPGKIVLVPNRKNEKNVDKSWYPRGAILID